MVYLFHPLFKWLVEFAENSFCILRPFQCTLTATSEKINVIIVAYRVSYYHQTFMWSHWSARSTTNSRGHLTLTGRSKVLD